MYNLGGAPRTYWTLARKGVLPMPYLMKIGKALSYRAEKMLEYAEMIESRVRAYVHIE